MTGLPPNLPEVVSTEEWVAARRDFLVREKELTRAKDALNADRRRLPMRLVDKDYEFDGPQGRVHLADLFEGRSQLVVQHFMFDPSWDDGCSSCTAGVDEISDGFLDHLRSRDTSFAVISRAPLAKLEDYKARRGWTLPWYSSFDSDFNYDFHVTLDATKAPIMFNYRTLPELQERGLGWIADGPNEQPGFSCFLRVDGSDGSDGSDGQIFHTYSAFGRGTEQFSDTYGVLDTTALGRQEDWEEPKGRSTATRGAVPDFLT
jgi:predicted dithiol-disulfide oxidoreductase (DUF899 family)